MSMHTNLIEYVISVYVCFQDSDEGIQKDLKAPPKKKSKLVCETSTIGPDKQKF